MAGISKKKIKTKKGEVIKYVITYRDVFGKQHTAGRYDTLKEAKRDLAKYENVDCDLKNITYGQIFNEFLKKAEKKYSFNTYATYSTYYNIYFKKLDGFKYEKINSITWQNFFDDIEIKKSPHIAQTCLKFARAATNYSLKHNIVDFNVFDKIEKAKVPKADINHLNRQEIKQVLDECKRSFNDYYALLFTFVGTGAREGEIFALTKKDFDFEKRTLRISKQFTRGRLVEKTKTESSNRVIYIFDELAEILKDHIEKLDKNNPLLFPNKKGGYLNSTNFRVRVFYEILKLCKINKRVRVHDLRGSYIDMVLSSGLSIKFAQNQAGHAKTETTLNVYAQNNEDMISQAQQTLNNVFEKQKKCELFVSQIKKSPNKKIIQFPKRSLDTAF